MTCFARLLVISMIHQLTIVTGPQPSTLLCPTGWESHGLKCYKLSHHDSNFLNAKKYCHGEVIMPKTEEENEIVKKLLYQVKFEISSEWNGIWIGLTDIENEGSWIWNDGTKLDSAFNDWHSEVGQPSRSHDENCVCINKKNKKWHDVPCNKNFSAVCQLRDFIVNEGESVNLTCGGVTYTLDGPDL